MNYFKEAERVLSSKTTLKKAVENLKRRQERLINSGAPREPGAIDYSKPYTDAHSVNDTLNQLLELSEVSKELAETENFITEIERVIEQLPKEFKNIVVWWYIERKTKEEIAELLYVESVTTVYDIRNKAIAQFAILYFGAGALLST
ncbi:MAG: hypothetical protein A2Y17_12235 [Clostridiales bacterium GWF2_38_85]|nr:MAG: hypothetical protein A2Y17_12235 [Clostridiales bacterium GWF2_38_85]